MTTTGEAGLTLVEMLVVLAIVAVAAGATALGIGSATRAPGAEAEARRLAATIQAAADMGMTGDATPALAADARGYRITGATGALAARHDLPGGLRLSGTGRDPVPLSIDGTGVPASLILHGAGRDWTIRYDGLRATAAAGT